MPNPAILEDWLLTPFHGLPRTPGHFRECWEKGCLSYSGMSSVSSKPVCLCRRVYWAKWSVPWQRTQVQWAESRAYYWIQQTRTQHRRLEDSQKRELGLVPWQLLVLSDFQYVWRSRCLAFTFLLSCWQLLGLWESCWPKHCKRDLIGPVAVLPSTVKLGFLILSVLKRYTLRYTCIL